MEYIIITLFGIFVGIAISGYMFVDEVDRKDRKIANQKAMIANRDILIARQCNQLTKIKTEVIKQQFNSVENLRNKIKSILSSNCEIN